MKNNESNKLGLVVVVANAAFLLGGGAALFHAQSLRLTAASHADTDSQVQAELTKLVENEREQFGRAQLILALDGLNDEAPQRIGEPVEKQVVGVGEQISEASSQIARIAQDVADEHETYEEFVEELTHAAGTNLDLVEKIQTLERLRREGRHEEANQFKSAVRTQADGLNMIRVQEGFHEGAVARAAEYHEGERASSWWFLGCAVVALGLWSVYFRCRWRQTRIELARSRVVKAPRAEHLRVARTGADASSDGGQAASGDMPLAGCRVLTAEDGPHNRRFIKRVLTNAGAEVTFAEDGDAAVNLAFAAAKDAQPFDVVLMDIQMPVMDGMEATKTLRRFHYQGPVVALSANSQDGDREACLNSGCDTYVEKPLSRDALLAAVAKFYAATDAGAEAVLATVE